MNDMNPQSKRLRPTGEYSWFDLMARNVLTRKLAGLRFGLVHIDDAKGAARFGNSSQLRANVDVNSPRFYRAIGLGGSLGAAEAYIRGDWDCAQLAELFRIMIRNRAASSKLDRAATRLADVLRRGAHWWRRNNRRGSRRNIAAHYDLGNEFFQLWLDESMAYSSGIFPSSRASLHEASLEKFDRACRKLDLRASDHVLEIGSGWGGFAIHAATHYGCRVTSCTISQEQFELAQQRINAAKLGDRITLLNADYRDIRGQFDKLVSIEMIEAVGYYYFDAFFGQLGKLLRPNGSALLQAIVMPERNYDRYLRGVDFIQQYVFPGGCLPSLSAMLESVGRTSDLRLVHVEDFASHYAETLRRWRQAFEESLPEIRRLGYDEQFIRKWRYYLCYCEAAFEERYIGVMQVQFDGPDCRRDPIRVTAQAAAGRNTLELVHQ